MAKKKGVSFLNYSHDNKLILVKISDFRRLIATETMSELLTA